MAIATTTVVFSGADNAPATWSLTSVVPKIIGYGITASAPVVVYFENKTNTGCTVRASSGFTGSVDITASD